MRVALVDRIVLAALALLLLAIGGGSAFVPGAFYESYGIDPAVSAELASELRGTGASLLLLGVAVAAGAAWTRWSFAAAVIGGIVMAGYAVGRGVSVALDGIPNEFVVAAGVVEVVFAVAAALVAVHTRPSA